MTGGMQASGLEQWRNCKYCGAKASILYLGYEREGWCNKCHKRTRYNSPVSHCNKKLDDEK